ncbi:MAG: ComEC family competence protein [Saprospiraceae bacterium]|jgi:competence protein ComEC|nr:ComEC family competence protein [Saprospiraceae bacterium]MBP9193261.1 ComEC family competence protein [Saprospiraceae bacterium]
MIPWRLFPYLRPCLAIIAGILVREFVTTEIWMVVFCLTITAAVVIANDFFYTSSIRYPFVAGYLILILYFGLGFLSHHLHNLPQGGIHYGHFVKEDKEVRVIGVIKEYPNRRKNYRTTLEVEFICYDSICCKARNPIQLSFNQDAVREFLPAPGDRICVWGTLSKIAKNTNPETFDFAKFLRRQKITHQLYTSNEVVHLASDQLGFFRQSSMNLRNQCLSIFEKYLKGESLGIAKAMVLGYRQDVEDDLYRSFSASGSMHILAVSGMHLAVIAEILLKTMNKLTFRRRKSGIIPSIAIIFLLWFFSFMTGAESAIIRSVLMFTLILYGKTLRHHHSTYNIMAFCAAIMLIFDPTQIFNAGFLFSYLALLSLMYFQPIILGWWQPADPFSNWMWQYISASIAAQILVGPLTIYLFNQFPLYFALSGFIPVWLSALSLKLGLLLLLTDFIMPEVNNVLSMGLDFMLTYFIHSVQWVESLPLACIDNIYLSMPEFIFYSLSSITLMVFVKFRTVGLIMAMTSFLAIGLVWRIASSWSENTQVLITVYDHKKVSLADVFIGHVCFSYGDSIAVSPYADYMYAGHRARHHIEKTNFVRGSSKKWVLNNLEIQSREIKYNKLKIAVIYKQEELQLVNSPSVYLIMGKLWPPLQKLYYPAPMLLNAEIKGKMLEQWKKYALEHNLVLYSVHDSGSIILTPPFKLPNYEKH